jgi:hypothetical protein
MKHLFTTLTFACFAITAFAQKKDPKGLTIGSELPTGDIMVKTITDEVFNLEQLKKENGLLIVFTNEDCPEVVKNQRQLLEAITISSDNNIGVLMINEPSATEVHQEHNELKELVKKNQYKAVYTVDMEKTLSEKFGAKSTPEAFLYDREGKLIYHGALSEYTDNPEGSKENYLVDALDKTLRNESPSPATTKVFGCSIR